MEKYENLKRKQFNHSEVKTLLFKTRKWKDRFQLISDLMNEFNNDSDKTKIQTNNINAIKDSCSFALISSEGCNYLVEYTDSISGNVDITISKNSDDADIGEQAPLWMVSNQWDEYRNEIEQLIDFIDNKKEVQSLVNWFMNNKPSNYIKKIIQLKYLEMYPENGSFISEISEKIVWRGSKNSLVQFLASLFNNDLISMREDSGNRNWELMEKIFTTSKGNLEKGYLNSKNESLMKDAQGKYINEAIESIAKKLKINK